MSDDLPLCQEHIHPDCVSERCPSFPIHGVHHGRLLQGIEQLFGMDWEPDADPCPMPRFHLFRRTR